MAVSNKKSAMARKAVNDVSVIKNSNNSYGEERIILWHNHFKDLFRNPPEITVSAIKNYKLFKHRNCHFYKV